ncbi:MAG: acetoacetate decarboxylase family protein [Rhodospirillaceae bacterium]|nr:acetoacetate decarboxylase family protein [Rhodospirillaceae bacterium]
MKGFTRPFSPNGLASALPRLPWRMAADQMMIHFAADPAAVNALIPPPMSPNPDMRGQAFLWTPNLMVDPLDPAEAAAASHPARTHYNVAVIAVPTLFNGKPSMISAFQWCDRDWLVILSWMIGTCSKLAEFHTTGTHPLMAANGGTRTGGLGTPLTRTASRLGQQLLRASLTPREAIAPAEMSFYFKNFPLVSERHLPDLHVPPRGKPLVHDLTQMVMGDATGSGHVRGPATLTFGDCDNEELKALEPLEVFAGYRWQMGFLLHGIEVVHDYLA